MSVCVCLYVCTCASLCVFVYVCLLCTYTSHWKGISSAESHNPIIHCVLQSWQNRVTAHLAVVMVTTPI